VSPCSLRDCTLNIRRFTFDSVITLAADRGGGIQDDDVPVNQHVEERPDRSQPQLFRGNAAGGLVEVFAEETGRAAID
jgi:hypothetical protein